MKFKNIKTEQNTTIIALGDVHYGSNECDLNFLKETIEQIKRKDNILVMLMGDIIDSGLKDSIGGGCFDNNKTPEEQLTNIVEILKPISNKIIGYITGNHEERIRVRTSIDVAKLISNQLGITYCGNSAFYKIRVGKQNYKLFATHGSSGALTSTGKINAVVKYNDFIEADIFMSGHTHDLLYHKQNYFKISNKDKMILKDKKHFIVTGHFLKYSGYAEAKNYAPGKKGSPMIKLNKNMKNIEVCF